MAAEDVSAAAEAAFIDFAHIAFDALRTRATTTPVDSRIYDTLRFNEDGSIPLVSVVRREYLGVIFSDSFIQWVVQAPEARACVEAQIADGILTTGWDDLKPFLWALYYATRRSENLSPTDEQMRETYLDFRHVWTIGIPRNTTIPLFGLTGDITHDESLSAHLVIGPFSATDKTTLWDSLAYTPTYRGLGEVPPIGGYQLGGAQLRLTAVENEGRPPQMGWIGVSYQDEVRDVITALRLLREGCVGIVVGFSHPSARFSNGMSGGWSSLSYHASGIHGSYTLHTTDLPALRELVNKLALSAVQKSLGVALRRFNQAYERSQLEDRLIDLTIALESSVLDEDPNELTYRLARRGAALIAQDRPPHETRETLEAVYAARSQIVHNGALISDKVTWKGFPASDLLARCEDCTRRILRSYVARLVAGSSLRSINTSLDNDLIDGLAALPRNCVGGMM